MAKKKELPGPVKNLIVEYIQAYLASKEALRRMDVSMNEIAEHKDLSSLVGEVIDWPDGRRFLFQDLFKDSNTRWQSVLVERFGIREIKGKQY